MNLFEHEDRQIIHRRKMGQSLFEIYSYFQNCEPLLDSVISLNHVCRICKEHELPYTFPQIKKVFNKIYDPTIYIENGKKYYIQCPKGDALRFLKTFSGNKHLFVKHIPSKKKVLPRIDLVQKPSIIKDYQKDEQMSIQVISNPGQSADRLQEEYDPLKYMGTTSYFQTVLELEQKEDNDVK